MDRFTPQELYTLRASLIVLIHDYRQEGMHPDTVGLRTANDLLERVQGEIDAR